jgi:hypothetical protein
MSYISDYKHSKHTEEDEFEYEQNCARENNRDRYEREHEFDREDYNE